jgi:hypothetical protein
MKTKKWTLLVIGSLSGIALTALAQSADLQPMVVGNLSGDLRIQQSIPCDDNVDQTTAVTQGRLEITPAEGIDVPGGKRFVLTRGSISFAPFTISRSCLGFGETRHYTQVAVQLAQATTFTASSVGGGIYNVSIPKDDFLIYEATVVNGDSETGYKHPSEDVTGTIDLAGGTVQMRVVLATQIHFKRGCVDPCIIGSCEVCIIDTTRNGRLTANLSGTIFFPDADADGVPDRNDNCRFVPNPSQAPVPTPVVTPPAALTLASCADHQIGLARAADVCDGGPVTVTNNAPATFALGLNVVTWTGEDTKHRIGTSPQNVTVVDTTAPIFTFVPPDIALNDCKAAELGLPIATDDCAGTPILTNNAPPIFPVGATVVTWTATDVSGNHTTDTQTVTVTDTVPPTVACVPAAPPGEIFQVSAIDHCTSSPIIRLGSFVLANGERIKIEETGKAGIELVNVIGPEHLRHFHVGKGQGVITATDESANVASATCIK